jgi:DNA-binding HxlR family transcriptional regulator
MSSHRDETISSSKISLIEQRILSDLNPEYAGYWKTINYLSDGKAHTWSEIKTRAELSEVAISKRLKKLLKLGVIKRNLIPSFPPKATYELDKKSPLHRWLMRNCELWRIDKQIAELDMQHDMKEKDRKKAYDDAMERMKQAATHYISRLLISPLDREDEDLAHLKRVFLTMGLVLPFWTLHETLAAPEENRIESIKTLLDESRKMMAPTEYAEEEKIVRKALVEIRT